MVEIHVPYRVRGKCSMCLDILWSWPDQKVQCMCGHCTIDDSMKSDTMMMMVTDQEMEDYIRLNNKIENTDTVVFEVI